MGRVGHPRLRTLPPGLRPSRWRYGERGRSATDTQLVHRPKVDAPCSRPNPQWKRIGPATSPQWPGWRGVVIPTIVRCAGPPLIQGGSGARNELGEFRSDHLNVAMAPGSAHCVRFWRDFVSCCASATALLAQGSPVGWVNTKEPTGAQRVRRSPCPGHRRRPGTAPPSGRRRRRLSGRHAPPVPGAPPGAAGPHQGAGRNRGTTSRPWP
jgi:hypothetical protein